ncbi:GNAT family N-acetyltransferase [Phenylobacterium sp.]|uniref:GNAT family N-acetyltransferase n=1 Tax=Phenylobacterium sp. TaxID=1871053 RepID=UPI0035AF0264
MTAIASAASSFVIHPEQAADAPLIDALHDHAFGPGRFTKVSERVREFAEFRPDLSFCAWQDQALLGSVRMWRVRIGRTEAVFLGPLAVQEAARKAGAGGALVEAASLAARDAGFALVLLVGDEPYFSRFGYSSANTAAVVMPGPVDQRRVLVRELVPGASEGLAGEVRPA